eukprot:scaffold603_cov404-Prasinococcus_capsulatus_cf.AAC.29
MSCRLTPVLRLPKARSLSGPLPFPRRHDDTAPLGVRRAGGQDVGAEGPGALVSTPLGDWTGSSLQQRSFAQSSRWLGQSRGATCGSTRARAGKVSWAPDICEVASNRCSTYNVSRVCLAGSRQSST